MFLLGVAADFVGRRTPVPRVSVLILFGLVVGPAGIDVLPGSISNWMPIVSDIALAVIGFLLGNSLKLSDLRKFGKAVFAISLSVVLFTAVLMGMGLWVAGMALPLAAVYAGIAPATDPASTFEVVRDSGGKNDFSKILLQITAIDDAWGVMFFSIIFAVSQLFVNGTGLHEGLMTGAFEVLISVAVGVLVGIPMSFFTGRIQPGEPSLAEALGMVFICSGIAIWLDGSYLLSSMVMGAVVANLARHHERPFYAIEGVEWPVIVLFFIFAGVSVRIEHISDNLLWVVLYVLLRMISRVAGAVAGARAGGRSYRFGFWMGMALMPQAGVALGMALTAAHRFEQFEPIVSVIAVTTVFFEVLGPVCTSFSVQRMKNYYRENSAGDD